MVMQKVCHSVGMGKNQQDQRGFTLVELAIVLGVASLLFGGLWRLMATGSAQLRDQAVAQEHTTLINAVRSYLGGKDGQEKLLANTGVGEEIPLPMAVTACTTQLKIECYLPEGFLAGKQNAYGQTYKVYFKKDGGAGAGVVATRYSFMVVTEGGDVIPDSSGNRISSMIGNDGGFYYSYEVCGANPRFCGWYGAWDAVPSDYNVTDPGIGHIGSRTSVGALTTSLDDDWLARKEKTERKEQLPNGGPMVSDYNMLQTHTFLYKDGATTNLYLGNNSIIGGYDIGVAAANAGGSVENIKLVDIKGDDDGSDSLSVRGSVSITGTKTPSGTTPIADASDLLVITNACSSIVTNPALCKEADGSPKYRKAMQVHGDAIFSGLVESLIFYAELFLYSSDENLKKEITLIDKALDKIAQIKGVSFLFKDETKNRPNLKHLGVIAQDVEKVFPELVFGKEGNKSVDYTSLLGPVIEAIKELKTRNESLQKDVEALKGEVSTLSSKVKKLEEKKAEPVKVKATKKSEAPATVAN